ncbi:putative signal peptide protein [Puccinia sorghi]|uniref:Putative signal peptide protein n=1 Tax=Puccinia sorghi TaxID=27349 RepID=A0A0L6VEX0_9BASI|nr:putative signal peptide protein [Puccinia sorghi]
MLPGGLKAVAIFIFFWEFCTATHNFKWRFGGNPPPFQIRELDLQPMFAGQNLVLGPARQRPVGRVLNPLLLFDMTGSKSGNVEIIGREKLNEMQVVLVNVSYHLVVLLLVYESNKEVYSNIFLTLNDNATKTPVQICTPTAAPVDWEFPSFTNSLKVLCVVTSSLRKVLLFSKKLILLCAPSLLLKMWRLKSTTRKQAIMMKTGVFLFFWLDSGMWVEHLLIWSYRTCFPSGTCLNQQKKKTSQKVFSGSASYTILWTDFPREVRVVTSGHGLDVVRVTRAVVRSRMSIVVVHRLLIFALVVSLISSLVTLAINGCLRLYSSLLIPSVSEVLTSSSPLFPFLAPLLAQYSTSLQKISTYVASCSLTRHSRKKRKTHFPRHVIVGLPTVYFLPKRLTAPLPLIRLMS